MELWFIGYRKQDFPSLLLISICQGKKSSQSTEPCKQKPNALNLNYGLLLSETTLYDENMIKSSLPK
jgi:hypothetical protein